MQILLRSNTIFTFNVTPAMSGSGIWADGYLIHGTGGVVSSVPLALKHNLLFDMYQGCKLQSSWTTRWLGCTRLCVLLRMKVDMPYRCLLGALNVTSILVM